jgi:hypothetical protein
MRARAAVVLVSIFALPAACDDPPPPGPSAAASASATLSPQPLRLPVVRPGEPCPTATAQAWSGPGQAAKVLGDGPLYPIADYFGGDAVLELRDDEREPDGSYEKKVRWLGAGYAGPVLLRAARIDGPGAASARFSYVGSSRDGGHYAELTNADSDLPATTTVGGPGCYAYQVDGTTFSKTIVFGAVEAP